MQSDSVSWYGRFSWAKDREYAPAAFPGLGTNTNSRPDQVLVGNTWVLGPALVNGVRFGWSRFDNTVVGTHSYTEDINGELLQISGLNLSGDPAFWGLPTFGITGYTGFGDRTNIYLTHNNIFEVADDLSWVRGKHVMKFGFSTKAIHYNQLGNQFALGGFDFDGTATQNPASRAGTGDPMADFLLGVTVTVLHRRAAGRCASCAAPTGSAYVGDSWRVSPKLTVDAGPPLRVPRRRSTTSTTSRVNITGLGSANPDPGSRLEPGRQPGALRRPDGALHAGHARARRPAGPRAGEARSQQLGPSPRCRLQPLANPPSCEPASASSTT